MKLKLKGREGKKLRKKPSKAQIQSGPKVLSQNLTNVSISCLQTQQQQRWKKGF